MPLLEMRHIAKRYGAVIANDDVNFRLEPGTVHALVGHNGAGKTTLMKVLYGLVQPDAGDILLDGRPTRLTSPRHALSQGLGMVHQHFMLIPPFTVLENIILGGEPHRWGILDRKQAAIQTRELMAAWGLELELHTPVERLSVGMRQRAEILRLLYQGAEILILDEPTAVLAPSEVDGLLSILRSVRTQGHSVVFISHKLHEVLDIADEISVMREGQIVGTLAAETASQQQIAAWMIGAQTAGSDPSGNNLEPVTSRSEHAQTPVLQVTDLTCATQRGHQLTGAELTVFPGEILGLAGIEGNGQDLLVDLLLGRYPPDSGTILFAGQPVARPHPRLMRKLGLAYVPADRQREGASLGSSIQENYLLGHTSRFSTHGILRTHGLIRELAEKIREYRMRGARPQLSLASLSGGNQQKLVIARELAASPKCVLACHPTRGLDIHATQFVHAQLRHQRSRGAGILLQSSDLDELLGLSDRIAVMFRGQIICVLDAPTTDKQEVGQWMLGPVGTT